VQPVVTEQASAATSGFRCHSEHPRLPYRQDIRWAAPDAPAVLFPLAAGTVSAGFPSPAADYEEERFDPTRHLVRNPVSTFFFTVQGDSMTGAEIFPGDTLAVDKSIQARHGHIVVAFINGERLVKRLYRKNGRLALLAENPIYPPLEITEETELLIWGVVVGLIKRIPV
jgi:DNA polymerase V